MPLVGRGKSYSKKRGAMEWALVRAYRGGWPAGLVRALGLQRPVRAVRHRLPCAAWPAGLRPLRVAFGSDFHAGPTTHASLLDEAARALDAHEPDVLLLGGDFVFLNADAIEQMTRVLARVRAPLGRFAVMGNHDLWADDRRIRRALEDAGVRVLVNESAHLPPPFDHVSVCGLDEPWTGSPDADATLDGARRVRVVLAHAPEALLLLGERDFDLVVCGHTHGGHIALPTGVPIVSVGPLCRRYPHGRHAIDARRTIIVSRGVGATESPLRWNADPDVIVIDLGAP